MIDVLTTVLYFLIAITILVTVHEYGHFYVARRCGVRVLRFSVGFGKRLVSWEDKHGTEFAISAIPLGGYVKMLDEREHDIDEDDLPYAFTQKTVAQRIAIASAGPLANFLLAIVFYWLLAMQGAVSVSPVLGDIESGSIADMAGLSAGQEIVAVDNEPVASRRDVEMQLINRLGETGHISFDVKYPDSELIYVSRAPIVKWLQGEVAPDVISGLGMRFYRPSVLLFVEMVQPDSPAAKGGFEVGDKVITIDGLSRSSGDQWSDYIGTRAGVELEIVVERVNSAGQMEPKTLLVTPAEVKDDSGAIRGLMGIRWSSETWPESMIRRSHYGVFGSLQQAVINTGDVISTVLMSLKKLIFGEISTKNLSGPIGIAKVVGDSAEAGIWTFVSVLAYISVLLGVFNLLPIPVLDGGHILFCLVEWVKGSPVSEKIQLMGFQAGLAMLMGVMVIAFYNDILRL
ncbi:RIP metalloprotease RseP [Teredinibacter purpureus]|uniref:RIP metalloprotease RseP n=1 Tax=Teredinibacter purpureus TaxID=2731756 RepID=UPI000AB4C600